ncbi:MAG: OmpA family protein [Comamonadaceae bacterium]
MNFINKAFLLAATLTLLAILAGCAAKGTGSYVVLLRDPDGNAGKVVVQNPQGEQVLTEVFKGAALDGKREPFFVMQDQLKRDFGAALAAAPLPPEQFLLYFETGGTELTARSKADLQLVLQRTRARPSPDISVIGHTDTVGPAEANKALGLRRATAMAEQLRQLGLQNALIAVESHGEGNLLVQTPDETAEARNRRVEITIR